MEGQLWRRLRQSLVLRLLLRGSLQGDQLQWNSYHWVPCAGADGGHAQPDFWQHGDGAAQRDVSLQLQGPPRAFCRVNNCLSRTKVLSSPPQVWVKYFSKVTMRWMYLYSFGSWHVKRLQTSAGARGERGGGNESVLQIPGGSHQAQGDGRDPDQQTAHLLRSRILRINLIELEHCAAAEQESKYKRNWCLWLS